MQIHHDIENLPRFRNAVVTIGTFDGVHVGHRYVLESLKAEAKAIHGETVIITFHPHPRKVVSSAILGIRLINTLEEKIELLEQLNIDHLVVVPFTEAFANQPAVDYIKDFLINKFRPHTIIIGYDHRFGRERLGDYRLLEKLAGNYNYHLKEIPKHLLDNISISSTNIREALLHNDIETADRLLGYEFFFEGEVVHGDKLGRKLGYPTANLRMHNEEKIIPANGIYAVYAEVRGRKSEVGSRKPEVGSQRSEAGSQRSEAGSQRSEAGSQKSEVGSRKSEVGDMEEEGNSGSKETSHSQLTTHHSPLTTHHSRFKGMMSIGFRPTVDGKKRVVEVNIFDFDEEIYGQTVRVYVKKYLREEIKFNSLEDLVKQIDRDKIESLKIL